MRRIIIYGFLIFIFSIFTGYMYSRIWKNGKELEKVSSYANQTYENEIKQTSTVPEEKIKYNAKFALKKHYSGCGHTKIENGELPIEFINLTEEEIKTNYSEWDIEVFNKDEITLAKNFEGICGEHFIIKMSEEGNVDIFNIDNLGNEMFLNSTEISKEYLTEEDVRKLEEGIAVYGVSSINSVLEDFE